MNDSPFGQIYNFVADCGKFRPGNLCRRLKGLKKGHYKICVRGFRKQAECDFVVRIYEQIREISESGMMSKQVMKSCLSRKRIKSEYGESVVIGEK